jgi:putative pyruvate formate lyase activating enzyme
LTENLRRQPLRIRVADDGSIEIVDPGPDEIALLREIDPGFALPSTVLPGFSGIPRLMATRQMGGGIARSDLAKVSDSELWRRHDDVLAASEREASGSDDASLLDIKIELADRLLRHCSLCARNCGVDRTRGERGACGLGADAIVAEAYLHVGEEAEIAPAFTFALAGCGLRCRFCQQYPLLAPDRIALQLLDRHLWDDSDLAAARSLSFNGGNPDENLCAVLRFVAGFRETPRLPLVWKTHSYVLPDTIRLLNGVVDCFVPDLKWGNEGCGRRLSRVADYPRIALAAVTEMAGQGVPVIVRVLIVPGHVDCCHLPSLDALAEIAATATAPIILSIRDQYAPDYLVRPGDGDLCRRPNVAEVDRVVAHARHRRLIRTGNLTQRRLCD